MARTSTSIRPGVRTNRSFGSGGSLSNSTSTLVNRFREDFTRSDVVKTPGWDASLNKKGKWYPPLPYSWQVTSLTGSDGIYRTTPSSNGSYSEATGCLTGWSTSFMGSNIPVPRFSSTEKSMLRSRAEIAALLKLKDQKINLAQAFAERQQTVNLIGDTAGRIARSLMALKKGDIRKAAEALKVKPPKRVPKGKYAKDRMSNEWLALQYGWNPLLNDVYGGAEALAEKDMAEPNRYIVTVKAGKKAKDSRRVVKDGGRLSDDYLNYRQIGLSRMKYGVRVSLSYVEDNTFTAEMASLGLTNPALLAWELMPWSFVVDWFLPLGNWISAMDATLGWNFKGGHYTTLEEVTHRRFYRTREWKLLDGLKKPRYSAISFDEIVSERYGYRGVYSSSPIPKITIKNPLSTTHALNALALLAGVKR